MARTLHLILALSAGFLLTLTALTGSILAFRGELDRALNPSLWRVEATTAKASLEQIRKAAEATGGPPARMLLVPDRDDRAMLVLLVGRDPSDRWEVFVDPHTAKVLGRRQFGSGWIERVKRLHVELFAGRIGRNSVGVGGLLWLFMGGTGLILWWRTRRVRTPHFGAFSLHRWIGLFSLVPSLILSTTGALLVFRPYVAPLLNLVTGPMPLDAKVSSRGDRTQIPPTLDQIRDRALMAYPDGKITRLYLPDRLDGTFDVRICLPEDQNPHGNTAIKFDRFEGTLLKAHSSRDTSLVQKFLWYAAYPWHTGDALGMAGRVVFAASALLPSGLMATGVTLWARRLRRERPGPMNA